MAVNAISYVKNLGKSFGYAAVGYFNDKNPSVKAMFDTAKDFSNELYESVQDFKEKLSDLDSEDNYLKEPIGLAKDFYHNLLDDIKTGKWYNKERSEKDLDDMASTFFGDDFDFDDMDDFDDFDLDDDDEDLVSFEDDDDDESVTEKMDTIGDKVSKAVSTATVKSAHYVVASGRQNTKVMLEQNNKFIYEVNNGMAAINANIASLVTLGKDINTHIQNSSVFFTKSTELQTKQVELLEKLVNNTSPIAGKTDTKSKKKRFSDVLGDNDVLDLREYAEAVIANVKEEVSMFTSMGDMFKDENGKGINVFKTFVSSPLQTVVEHAVELVVPKMVKDTMESFNESLSGFFGSLLLNINKASHENPIIDTLLKFLGVKNTLKTSLSTSGYEKGKVDFDGITRKSIIEVIPTYLSKILSAVSGKEETRYDYSSGTFRTMSQVKTSKDDIVRTAAKSAGYDLMDEFRDLLDEKGYTVSEKEKMLESMADFLVASVEKGEKFNYRQPQKINDAMLEKFGIKDRVFGDTLVDFMNYLEDEDKGHIMLNLNKEIALAREKISDEYRSLELRGDSVINALYNNSDNTAMLASSPLNLNNIYDEKHNNIFYYLQNIYKHIRHLSDNVGVGGKGKGGSSAAIKAIREVEDNTVKTIAKTAGRIEYTESQYDTFISDIDQELMEDKNILVYADYMKLNESERSDYIAKLVEAKRKTKDKKEKFDHIKESANDLISKVVGGVTKLFNKPMELVSDILKKANKSMLDIIYGKEGEDNAGFLGFILSETKALFGKMADWVDENIMDRFGFMHVRDKIDEIFGEKGSDGKRHGGKLGEIGNNIMDNLGSAGEWIKDSFGTVAGFASGLTAAEGGNVTKTGLVAVSEGEMIIPSELNPFYKGKTDKKKQKKNEESIIKRFFGKDSEDLSEEDGYWGSYAEGTSDAKKGTKLSKEQIEELKSKILTEISNIKERTHKKKVSTFSSLDGGDKLAYAAKEITNKFMGTKRDPGLGRRMGSTLTDGVAAVFDELFDTSDEKKAERNKKIKKVTHSVLEEMGVPSNIAGIIGGTLMGGGVSLLTGGIISPLLGAGVGAGIGLIAKSETVQNALFGNEKENGLLPEDVADFVQTKFPDIAKFATVGGIGGLIGLAPGGPVGGIILGSALGYAAKSEKVKEYLFGTEDKDGLISKKLQAKLKEIAPNLALGAVGGLIAGPFGVIGNILFGATIGYVTTLEDFKDKLFGDFGLIKQVKEKFIKPLGDAAISIGYEAKYQVKNLFKTLQKNLYDLTKEFVIIPISKVLKDYMSPLFNGLKKALGIIATPLALPFMGFAKLGEAIKTKQVKKGQASYMTAKQRLGYRYDHGMKEDAMSQFDERLASMNAKDLGKFKSYLTMIENPEKEIQKNAKDTLSDIVNKLSSDDRLSTKEIWNIQKSIKSGNTDEAMDRFDSYMKERDVSEEDSKDLRNKIVEDVNKFNSYKKHQQDVGGYAKEKMEEISKELGMDINEKNAWKFKDLLDRELKDRKQNDSPQLQLLDQNKTHHEELMHKIDQIINRLPALRDVAPEDRPLPGQIPLADPLTQNKLNAEVEKLDMQKKIDRAKNDAINNFDPFDFGTSSELVNKALGLEEDAIFNKMDIHHKGKYKHIPESIAKGYKKLDVPLREIINEYNYIRKNGVEINSIYDSEPSKPSKNQLSWVEKKLTPSGLIDKLESGEGATLSEFINGYKEDISKAKNKDKEKFSYIPTSSGDLVKYTTNGQGEPVPDISDSLTREVLERQRQVQDAHIKTSENLGGIHTTLGSLFGKLFNKKDKDKDEKKGILSFLKDKFKSMFDWVTGGKLKSLLAGIGKSILLTGSSILVGAIAGKIIATVIKAFGGDKVIQEKLDKVLSVITGGGNDPKNSEGGYYYDKTDTTIDVNGESYNILVDENGNPQTDENGNYIDVNGNVIEDSSGQWVTKKQSGKTLQQGLIEGEVRGAVFGRPTVLTKTKDLAMWAKNKILRNKKAAKNAISLLTPEEAAEKLAKSKSKKLSKQAAKLAKKATKKTAKAATATSEKAASKLTKQAAKLTADSNSLTRMAERVAEGKDMIDIVDDGVLAKGADAAKDASLNATKKGLNNKIFKLSKKIPKLEAKLAKASPKKAAKLTKKMDKIVAKATSLGSEAQAIADGTGRVTTKTAAKATFTSKIYTTVMSTVQKLLAKIPEVMNKIPFLNKYVGKSNKIAEILYKYIDDVAIKMGPKLGSLVSSLSSALGYVKIAFMIADFYTGYEDARTTLGIVEEPTEGQRLISGLIRLVKNLIPVIGAFIPDKSLVDLFVDKIAPILGIKTKNLSRQREEAQREVEYYNQEHGTDYTIEDYNKKVLKDYTITEKAGNFIKSVKNNIKEKGFIGAIKSGINERVENAKDAFNKNYEEGGIIPAIAEMLHSLLPGPLGDAGKACVEMGDLAMQGKVIDIFAYSTSPDKKSGMVTQVLEQCVLSLPKLVLMPIAGIVAAFKSIGNFIKTGITFIKEAADVSGIQKAMENVDTFEELYTLEPTVSPDHMFYDFNRFAIFTTQAVYTPVIFVKNIVKGVQTAFNFIKDKISGMIEEIQEFSDDPIGYMKKKTEEAGKKITKTAKDAKDGWDYYTSEVKEKGFKQATKDFFTTIFGKGSGINKNMSKYVGGSSGFISQTDQQYSNMTYGDNNVGANGCGPAVAAMAVNNAYGAGNNVISMKDTLAYAKRHGYERPDGTSADYFGSVFEENGMDSEYINNVNGNKSSKIEEQLAKGSSVVLLGKDKNNTSKANSPFGPNNHYVLATGMDKNGNVTVNDPEMNQPTVYNKEILNNANLAISTSNSNPVASGSRITNRINKVNRFKVYVGGASSNEKKIFDFLTDPTNGMGLNTAAACGILANIRHESGFDNTAVGDNGTSYGICQWHKGRFDALKKYCSDNGLDYKSLHGQLKYLQHELTKKYTKVYNKIAGVADTAQGAYDAAYVWCYDFEIPANRAKKAVERGNSAKNEYYPKYKGTSGSYSSSGISISSTSSGENSGENGLESIQSMFGNMISAYYGNDIANLLGIGSTSKKEEEVTTEEENNPMSIIDNAIGATTTTNTASNKNMGKTLLQDQLVNKMRSVSGKLKYSQSGPRNPDKGSADCSSTVNWAYKKVTGVDIGNDTGAILNDADTVVVQQSLGAVPSRPVNNSSGPIESGLQPGDLLLYSRNNIGRPYGVGHVEMYAGNGKRLGHGGGLGPKESSLSTDKSRFIMAKRLKKFTTGKGSGINGRDYLNTEHELGSIMNTDNNNRSQEKTLKNKAKAAIRTIHSGKGSSTSDETMITLVKSIIAILTTMANNSSKINTIAELLQNYFNAKNNATNQNKQPNVTNKSKTVDTTVSPELDAATKELVNYLNTLAAS